MFISVVLLVIPHGNLSQMSVTLHSQLHTSVIGLKSYVIGNHQHSLICHSDILNIISATKINFDAYDPQLDAEVTSAMRRYCCLQGQLWDLRLIYKRMGK